MQKYFITATGTGVGKTTLTTLLCHQLISSGKNILALKPVVSGYSDADKTTDTALILGALGKELSPENINAVSPWRLAAALSPNMAAEKEGRKLVLSDIVGFCKSHEDKNLDYLLVEGVGGVYVPLNEKETLLDWMEALNDWKIILVAGSYLGSISHTLTAVEALKSRGLAPYSIVISQSADDSVDMQDTLTTLKNFINPKVKIVTLERFVDYNNRKLPKMIEMCL